MLTQSSLGRKFMTLWVITFVESYIRESTVTFLTYGIIQASFKCHDIQCFGYVWKVTVCNTGVGRYAVTVH